MLQDPERYFALIDEIDSDADQKRDLIRHVQLVVESVLDWAEQQSLSGGYQPKKSIFDSETDEISVNCTSSQGIALAQLFESMTATVPKGEET